MNKKSRKNTPVFRTAEVVTLVLITCVVSLLMGIIICEPNEILSDISNDTTPELQKFIEEYNYIIKNYYGQTTEKELLESALKGMLDSLDDPYSSYLDENESSSFNTTLNGSYEGIGVEITNDQNMNIVVTRVFENTPAERAGIKPNDLIVSMNNKQITNTTTTDFVAMAKEVESASFTLGLKRGEENLTVTVSREHVTLSSVSSEIINKSNKKIGYINISIFAANTDTQFKETLKQLETDGIDSLIIDLRGNSGGHLTSVENMISEFLDEEHIIYQMESKTKKAVYYSKGKVTKTYPIVLLVDGNSASASEMMTAALSESYGATIVGTTTYGKGTVQELQDSNDNQYKLTTKRWLTPNGNWIHGIGIKPDYEVYQNESYYKEPTKQNDAQLQKAIELLTK